MTGIQKVKMKKTNSIENAATPVQIQTFPEIFKPTYFFSVFLLIHLFIIRIIIPVIINAKAETTKILNVSLYKII